MSIILKELRTIKRIRIKSISSYDPFRSEEERKEYLKRNQNYMKKIKNYRLANPKAIKNQMNEME